MTTKEMNKIKEGIYYNGIMFKTKTPNAYMQLSVNVDSSYNIS